MATTELRHINLGEIREPDEKLRKVDPESEKYQGLVESVRKNGILNPISVRELKDEETGETFFSLVDGLHRYCASKDAGKESIPCHIIPLEEGALIEAQVIANVHKIETKPVEYSRALMRILNDNPLMSRSELASTLSKTPAWISERLGLLKLKDEVGGLVDSDKIGLSNAYALAKLPPEEQLEFIDRAMSMTPAQFAPLVNTRVSDIKKAKRQGKDAPPEEFQPIPTIRSRAELISELEREKAGPALCGKFTPASVEEAFKLAISWALNVDPDSAEEQRVADEERRLEKKRKKEEGTLERKKKRAKEAAERAAKLQQEAEEAEKKVAAEAAEQAS